MKKLSIVIPVFNKFNFTKAALIDLSKLPKDHQIIVIDNGSSDETQIQLTDSKEITYLRNNINKGFAAASNQGYQLSSATNVMFLNNDIRVRENHHNWTLPIIAELNKNEVCLMGPTMGQLDNNLNFVQEANKVLTGNSYMSGWCVSGSKTTFDKLIINSYAGPFSEEFGIAYFEDTDLSFRAKLLDIAFKVIEIPVVHFGKQTSKQLNTHQLYSQARKIFVEKWKSK
jgi:GT2 family glycosyltransferase